MLTHNRAIAEELVQEAFAEFDVPWRNDLVGGWNPIKDGEFLVSDAPGLGLELDEDSCFRPAVAAQHFNLASAIEAPNLLQDLRDLVSSLGDWLAPAVALIFLIVLLRAQFAF